MSYFIYIIECKNGSYYTGYTLDIVRRYREHQQRSAKCKYTRSFPPKRLVACWEVLSELSSVLKIESAIKKLKRAGKIELIIKPKSLISILTRVGLNGDDLSNTFQLEEIRQLLD